MNLPTLALLFKINCYFHHFYSFLRHIRRISNGAAHILARQGLSVENELVWLDEIPECIANIVQSDLSLKK